MSVVLTANARADLDQIFDYIADDNPAAAERTTDRILQSLYMLERFPQLAVEGSIAGTRELSIPRLPYRAIYRILGDEVEILRILHARRQWPRGSN